MIEYVLSRLLMMSIAGSAATLILLLAKPLTSRLFPGKWHYLTYVAVLPVFLFPLSGLSNQNTDVPYERDSDTAEEFIILYITDEARDTNTNTQRSEPQNTRLFEIPQDMPDFILYIWIFGAILFLFFSVFSYLVYFARVKRASTPYITATSEYPGLNIYKSGAVSSPVLFGFLRGSLYLPDRDFSDTELKNILCHEYVHFKRCDIGIKWLCLLAKTVHLFNPFVHLLSRSIELWCEISCDENATKDMDKHGIRLYCETILSLISANKKEYRLALGVSGTKRNLERRFKAIMKEKKFSKKTIIISAIIASMVLLSAITVSAILGSKVEQNKNNITDTQKNTENLIEDDSFPVLSSGEIKVSDTDYSYTENKEDTVSDSSTSENEPVVKYHVINHESDTSEIITDGNGTEYRLIPYSENTSGAAQISAPYDVEKHTGVDYRLEAGTEIASPIEGTVKVAEYNSEKGNHITVEGLDGTSSILLAHLEKMYVKADDKVNIGDILGTVGTTGMSTGPHLHIEYYENGETKNPVNVVFVESDGKISALFSEPERIID